MDTQTMVLETISKQNQFKRPDENLSDVLQDHHNNYIKKVHHTSQHEQRNIQEQSRTETSIPIKQYNEATLEK